MSNSRVREALVGSVAKTPPAVPPVSCQSSQESTVPRARCGEAAASPSPPSSSSQAYLVAEK